MRKSTVIAICLVNSKMISSLAQAESAVRKVFEDEFVVRDFSEWNVDMSDQVGQSIIQSVGRASRINVRRFIIDLESQSALDADGQVSRDGQNDDGDGGDGEDAVWGSGRD